MYRSNRGLTLIELLIVVSIIGVLVAVAVPTYNEHVRKARRADAQAALMELSQFMERYYTANGRYRTAAGTAPTLPFTTSPKGSSNAFYNLSLSAVTDTSFTLRAAPTGAMTGDSCGNLTITNTGVRAPANCW